MINEINKINKNQNQNSTTKKNYSDGIQTLVEDVKKSRRCVLSPYSHVASLEKKIITIIFT